MSLRQFRKMAFQNQEVSRLQDHIEQYLLQLGGYPAQPIGIDSMRITKPSFVVLSNRIQIDADANALWHVAINGSIYTINETLYCSLAQNGFHGLDVGSAVTDTCYYLYIALHLGKLGIVATLISPQNGGKPRGFPYATYIGACRTYPSPSTSIHKCVSRAGWVELDSKVDALSHTGDTNWTQKTFVGPDTAKFVTGNINIEGPNIGADGKIAGDSAPPTFAHYTDHIVANRTNQNYCVVPITIPNTVYLQTSDGANTVKFYQTGWVDEPEKYE